MKQRLLAAWIVVVVLFPVALRADPITIVNTGPGPSTSAGFSLGGLQWVAAEFVITGPAAVTAVEAWMSVYRGGTLDVALYEDGGETPGAVLFRSTGIVAEGEAAWRGLTTLGWSVGPGTYWIGFEVPGPAGMGGTLPNPSERPLMNGAVVDREFETGYQEADAVAQMGLRVFAEEAAAPVPEPASMLLLATGMAGLLARRRRGEPRIR